MLKGTYPALFPAAGGLLALGAVVATYSVAWGLGIATVGTFVLILAIWSWNISRAHASVSTHPAC